MLAHELPYKELSTGTSTATLMVELGLCASLSEARRLIDSGAVSVNGDKVSDTHHQIISGSALHNQWALIKRGKNQFGLVKFSGTA